MSKLEDLVKKLEGQSKEMESTVNELIPLIRESGSHELKYRFLTCIATGHFGLNGLQESTKNLSKAVQEG